MGCCACSRTPFVFGGPLAAMLLSCVVGHVICAAFALMARWGGWSCALCALNPVFGPSWLACGLRVAGGVALYGDVSLLFGLVTLFRSSGLHSRAGGCLLYWRTSRNCERNYSLALLSFMAHRVPNLSSWQAYLGGGCPYRIAHGPIPGRCAKVPSGVRPILNPSF